ncbi:MAG: RNA 2',3'-cyclic phosphodiesterase [Planctomycetota bacterium]|jgi:2'-5' RNA ligase
MSPSARNTFRLFVAIYPPLEVAQALLAALRQVELPDHRLVPVAQVHMTLHFIGDTPAPQMEETTETVGRATGGVDGFDLVPQCLITLPQRGRARLVAAEADRPAGLMEIQRRLALRLARDARRNPSDRFRPHLTLCRFRSPASMRGVDEALEIEPFAVGEISLMRSTLRPQGAQHDVVASFPLGGAS